MPAKDTIITPFTMDKTKVSVETNPLNASEIGGDGAGYYEPGDVINVSVVSTRLFNENNSKYTFENWTLDNSVISENTELEYTVTEDDVTLVANYMTEHKFGAISSNTSLGTVSSSLQPWVKVGDMTPSRTATPNKSYSVFNHWTLDDEIVVDEGGTPYGCLLYTSRCV